MNKDFVVFIIARLVGSLSIKGANGSNKLYKLIRSLNWQLASGNPVAYLQVQPRSLTDPAGGQREACNWLGNFSTREASDWLRHEVFKQITKQ